MIKSIVVKLTKRYIVNSLNDILENKSKDVNSAKAQIKIWTERIKRVLEVLDSAMKYLEDNKLDDNEVDEIVSKAEVAIDGAKICADSSAS